MKAFNSYFLSDSDQDDIDRMVTKDKKNRTNKIANIQNQPRSSSAHQDNNSKQNQDNQQDFRPQKYLGSNMQDSKKITHKIVKLYHKFFNRQKSSTKAEEIIHVYKKKLCDDGIIVPTIFCWLNDWIAKQFVHFIKKQISQITSYRKNSLESHKKQHLIQTAKLQRNANETKDSPNLKASVIFQPPNQPSKKKIKRKLNQKELEPDMFFSIDLNHEKSKEDLYEKIDKISMIKKNSIELTKEKKDTEDQNKSGKRISLQKAQMFLKIDINESKSGRYKETGKEERNLSINSYEISNLLPMRPLSIQEPLKKQIWPYEQTEASPINRQILIGAFYQKFYNMYRNLESILPDLDIQYIKQIKRNDRKPQIKKRIKQISRVLTRNQPLIKNSVEDYQISYFERKNRIKKHNRNRKNAADKGKAKCQVNDPQTQPTTRYSSLEYSSGIIQKSITSEKKITSNRYIRKDVLEQSNLQRIYEKKRQERQKQVFSLNRPIKLEFNLPSLPDKQRNIQPKFKEQSKIVLIQSGRYKLLDTIEPNDLIQMGNRKNKYTNYSIDFGQLDAKTSQSLQPNSSYSPKKIAQFDKRSVSIFQMITKKKKNIPQQSFQISTFLQSEEVIPTPARPSRRKTRNTKSIKDNKQAQQQLKQALLTLENNDYEMISAWSKGQSSPQMN